MHIQPLLDTPSELIGGGAPTGPVVLSTRVRLARNLRDMPFPGWAKETQRRDILFRCLAATDGLSQMKRSLTLRMDELTELEKQVLVERHLISRELSSASIGAGVVISRDQSCSIMINEEDHLRIQVMRSGFHFKRTWKAIDALDSAMEECLDFAFSPELGYLTACPTNVGTGMRASVMMHLPALVLSGQMEKVIRAVNQLGIAVRGLFGEGSDASGSIFQISNQQTLGESEDEILKRLTAVLQTVVDQEENARHKLLETEPLKLFDKIGRSYGALQNGHLLSSAEAMNFLSLIRLAVDLKILPEEARSQIDRLFIETQPGHIQITHPGMAETSRRDALRARMLRARMKDIPALNFDNAPSA